MVSAKPGLGGGGIVSTDWQVYRGGPEHRQAVTAMGRILVVMLGTNDIAPWNRAEAPAHFTADYAAFVAELLALPQRPQVVLCTPPAIDTSFPGIDAPHEEVMTATINPAIQAVAKARKLPVIDVHAACAGKAGLLADGVHPNSAGNQVLAETIQAGLAALFRKPAKTAAPR